MTPHDGGDQDDTMLAKNGYSNGQTSINKGPTSMSLSQPPEINPQSQGDKNMMDEEENIDEDTPIAKGIKVRHGIMGQ